MTPARLVSVSTLPSGDGKAGAGERGVCTLLGPEGPGLPLSGGVFFPLDLFWFPFWGWPGRYRPYVENYTVDASILKNR